MTLPRYYFNILFLGFLVYLLPMFISYAAAEPAVKDNNLKVETYAQGLSSPSSTAFLDDDQILILQ